MVMFEKLKIVFGESNEINGAKNCLRLIRSEKNCMFKLEVRKKSLITNKNHKPPSCQMVHPKTMLLDQQYVRSANMNMFRICIRPVASRSNTSLFYRFLSFLYLLCL